MVTPVLEDGDSCHQAVSNSPLVANAEADECTEVIVETISFSDVAVTDSVFTTLKAFDIDFSSVLTQEKCNSGDSSNV